MAWQSGVSRGGQWPLPNLGRKAFFMLHPSATHGQNCILSRHYRFVESKALCPLSFDISDPHLLIFSLFPGHIWASINWIISQTVWLLKLFPAILNITSTGWQSSLLYASAMHLLPSSQSAANPLFMPLCFSWQLFFFLFTLCSTTNCVFGYC